MNKSAPKIYYTINHHIIKFLLITIILLLDLILKLNDIRKKIINELEIKLTLIQRFNVI